MGFRPDAEFDGFVEDRFEVACNAVHHTVFGHLKLKGTVPPVVNLLTCHTTQNQAFFFF